MKLHVGCHLPAPPLLAGERMNDLLSAILAGLPDGRVDRAVIGRRWTAVVADIRGEKHCGLAASWRLPEEEGHPGPQVEGLAVGSLAADLREARGLRASLAAAAVNAALPQFPEQWHDEKVEQVICRRGAGRLVAMIGHFPFVDQVRPHVGSLAVLEERPRPGDLPASAAAEVLPRAEVVVITGMAFLNGTLEDLLAWCSPSAHVILAGPSTPLSPALFEHGVHELCGAVVTDIEPVLRAVQQGESPHGMHQTGVRLVTIRADRAS